MSAELPKKQRSLFSTPLRFNPDQGGSEAAKASEPVAAFSLPFVKREIAPDLRVSVPISIPVDLEGDSFLALPEPQATSERSFLYTPNTLGAGEYRLTPYLPLAALSMFFSVHVLHSPDETFNLNVRSRAEMEKVNARILGFMFLTRGAPMGHSSAHLLCGSRARAESLSLVNLRGDTLQKNEVQPRLVFKNDHLVIYHANNVFTLACVTSFSPRMQNVMTAI